MWRSNLTQQNEKLNKSLYGFETQIFRFRGAIIREVIIQGTIVLGVIIWVQFTLGAIVTHCLWNLFFDPWNLFFDPDPFKLNCFDIFGNSKAFRTVL